VGAVGEVTDRVFWVDGRAYRTFPRSHCSNGHEFTEENTRFSYRQDGSVRCRICRTCQREWAARKRARVRVAQVNEAAPVEASKVFARVVTSHVFASREAYNAWARSMQPLLGGDWLLSPDSSVTSVMLDEVKEVDTVPGVGDGVREFWNRIGVGYAGYPEVS